MISWFLLALRTLRGMARSRLSLSAENAILRHQLAVLQRGRPRPFLRPADGAQDSGSFVVPTASPGGFGRIWSCPEIPGSDPYMARCAPRCRPVARSSRVDGHRSRPQRLL